MATENNIQNAQSLLAAWSVRTFKDCPACTAMLVNTQGMKIPKIRLFGLSDTQIESLPARFDGWNPECKEWDKDLRRPYLEMPENLTENLLRSLAALPQPYVRPIPSEQDIPKWTRGCLRKPWASPSTMEDYLCRIIRMVRGHGENALCAIYWYDQTGILREQIGTYKEYRALEQQLLRTNRQFPDTQIGGIGDTPWNRDVWTACVNHTHPGQSIWDTLETYWQTAEKAKTRGLWSTRELAKELKPYRPDPEELKTKFGKYGLLTDDIGTIFPPSFERETGNHKKGTFDFIRVRITLCRKGRDKKTLLSFIKENKAALAETAVKRVRDDYRLEKYGIPVNVLRLTRLTLTTDDILEFIFELKKLPENKERK